MTGDIDLYERLERGGKGAIDLDRRHSIPQSKTTRFKAREGRKYGKERRLTEFDTTIIPTTLRPKLLRGDHLLEQ